MVCLRRLTNPATTICLWLQICKPNCKPTTRHRAVLGITSQDCKRKNGEQEHTLSYCAAQASRRILELENRCTGNRTVGSNPTLSAKILLLFKRLAERTLFTICAESRYIDCQLAAGRRFARLTAKRFRSSVTLTCVERWPSPKLPAPRQYHQSPQAASSRQRPLRASAFLP